MRFENLQHSDGAKCHACAMAYHKDADATLAVNVGFGTVFFCAEHEPAARVFDWRGIDAKIGFNGMPEHPVSLVDAAAVEIARARTYDFTALGAEYYNALSVNSVLPGVVMLAVSCAMHDNKQPALSIESVFRCRRQYIVRLTNGTEYVAENNVLTLDTVVCHV